MQVDLHALLGLCFRCVPKSGMHQTSYQSGRYVCRRTHTTDLQDIAHIWADLQVELVKLLVSDLLHLNTTLPPLRGYDGREPLSVPKIRAAIAQLPNPHHLPVGVLLDPSGLPDPSDLPDSFGPDDVRLLVVDTSYFPVRDGVLTGAVILLPETEAAHKATFHCVTYPYHNAGFPYQQEIRFPWGSLWGGYQKDRAQVRVCSADLFFVAGEGVALPYSS